jgi:hypothetical protein
MSDPRLHSLHLEGQPRREQFRAARQAIQAACGSHTLAGDLHMLVPDERLDASTLVAPPGGPAAAGRFTFYLKDGSNVYPLHLGLNSVGRLPDNDVVIRDECVSRRHCAILVHSDLRCELHDVASKNGTLLNGKKIGGPTRLQSGDLIVLCNRRLSFHMCEGVEPAAAG